MQDRTIEGRNKGRLNRVQFESRLPPKLVVLGVGFGIQPQHRSHNEVHLPTKKFWRIGTCDTFAWRKITQQTAERTFER